MLLKKRWANQDISWVLLLQLLDRKLPDHFHQQKNFLGVRFHKNKIVFDTFHIISWVTRQEESWNHSLKNWIRSSTVLTFVILIRLNHCRSLSVNIVHSLTFSWIFLSITKPDQFSKWVFIDNSFQQALSNYWKMLFS